MNVLIDEHTATNNTVDASEAVEKRSFTYAELFAGVGGFRQALDDLGGRCVFASEIDKYAKKSYQALYGDKELHGDITEIAEKDIPDHDLLVGGFPCQAFSIAGQRKGFEDTRGTLFFEIARIAAVKKPRLLLIENVKGLLSHDSGNTFEVMCKTLNEIGYAIDFRILNSKYFGVPQNRERIFIIADRDATHEPWNVGKGNDVVTKAKRRANTFGIRSFNFDWSSEDKVTTRLRDILETNVNEKYYLSEDRTAKFLAQLNECNDSADPLVFGSLEHYGNDQMNRVYSVDGIAPTITVVSGGGREQKIAEPNVHSNGIAIGKYPRYRIRKLTPLECWRLQGFSDEAHEAVKTAGVSDSQRYKQAGNAVTVNVIMALGKPLIARLHTAGVEIE